MELKNKQIVIETTNICDAKCVICPRESFKQKLQIMDMGLFKKIIDDAAQYGLESVDTCGYGDCFLDNKLFDRFRYIREKLPKAEIFISTTAFHMTPEKWESVADLVDILKLSIYGVTPEIYNAFHGGNVNYGGSMRNILGFLDFTKKKKRPYTIGLFVTTDLNRHEKDQWIETWEPVLDEVFVWEPHNWVNNRSYRNVDHTRQCTCGRPENGPVYIHADGTASPCCWDIHKELKLGDFNTQTIEEIYKGEAYQELRRKHRAGDFSGLLCENCDQTNYNPDVLLYANNKARKVGQITSNAKAIREEGNVPLHTADVGDSVLSGESCGCL